MTTCTRSATERGPSLIAVGRLSSPRSRVRVLAEMGRRFIPQIVNFLLA